MKTLFAFFLIVENLNTFAWIIFGVVYILFLDSPGAKVSDSWWLWALAVVNIGIAVSTIFLMSAGDGPERFKYWIIGGFIISLLTSAPAVYYYIYKADSINKNNAISALIETKKENKTPLTEKELTDYLNFLNKKDTPATYIQDFDDLLKRNLINPTEALNQVALLDISFLKKVLEYNPEIVSNASLVLDLTIATNTEEDAKTNIEKMKLLLEYGLNPYKEDYIYNSKITQSAVQILEKEIESDTSIIKEEIESNIAYAKSEGIDPSKVKSDFLMLYEAKLLFDEEALKLIESMK